MISRRIHGPNYGLIIFFSGAFFPPFKQRGWGGLLLHFLLSLAFLP